jgi:hypothetical protein
MEGDGMKRVLSKACIILLCCVLATGCTTKAGGALTAYKDKKPVVGIGMSRADVKKALGEPVKTEENMDSYDGLNISYYENVVYSVKITNDQYTDAAGYTVGSTLQEIRDGIPQAQPEYQCLSVYYDDDKQPMEQFENSHYVVSYWESESDSSKVGMITIFNMNAATSSKK